MNRYKGKKILIFGLGLNQGGVGAVKFFSALGAKVRVTDLRDAGTLKPSLEELKNLPDINYTLGEHKYGDFEWADLILRNPAIKDSSPYLNYALENKKIVETDFSIFLEFANQKKIIAVTGTKGKSTTSSLIYEAMKLSGKEVVFAGNIGRSILDIIPYLEKDPWIIVEISSFQLHALKNENFAPHIAVITNIYPDHLNWHSSMEEYINAKISIAKNQTDQDFLFVSTHKLSGHQIPLKGIKSSVFIFCGECFKEDYPNSNFTLKGTANMENYAAAFSVTDTLGIDEKTIFQAFKNFKGGEFRMQTLREVSGIKIINDSTATNPISTIEALKTLSGTSVILIAGGMNKGMPYHELTAQIESYSPVKSLYLLEGDATDELKKYIRDPHLVKGKGTYNDLEQLLRDIRKEAKKGDVILFSPGATSFNLFQNEFDRGRKFNIAVDKIFV